MSHLINRTLKRWNPSRMINRSFRNGIAKTSQLTPLYSFAPLLQTKRNFGSTTATLNANKGATFVVGVDGTNYGYLALEHAFRLARANDKIIGLHIPLDLYQFAYEQLVFSTGVTITQQQKDTYHKKRDEFIKQIEGNVNDLTKQCNSNNINFEFVVHDDSVAVKYDLVDAVDELKCDYLVLGSKGHSHSIKEAVEKKVVDILGSVPDYCVHNANCSVLVVKPED